MDSFDVLQRIARMMNQKTPADDPEVQNLLSDFQRFYPPVSPKFASFAGVTIQPVTMDSPLHIRFMVEFFAESFRQEASFLFKKHLGIQSPIQFSALRRDMEYEAWLIADKDTGVDFSSEEELSEAGAEENIDQIFQALGCCLFYRDNRLTQEQQRQSEWIGAFAWVHPCYRRTGFLKSVWDRFEKYGDFWIEGPVSEEMHKFMDARNISSERVLPPDRYKEKQKEQSSEGGLTGA